MRTFNIKCCFVIEVAVMREEKRLNMECASGIIAQGINLAKVLEPIEWFFASILVTCLCSIITEYRYGMHIYKNECLNRGKKLLGIVCKNLLMCLLGNFIWCKQDLGIKIA